MIKIERKQKKRTYFWRRCCVGIFIFLLAFGGMSGSVGAQGAGEASSSLSLCPGGWTFGMKLQSRGVTVSDTSSFSSEGKVVSPAKEAGLLPKDRILQANGCDITSADSLMQAVQKGNGAPLRLHIRRGEKELDLTLTPAYSDTFASYRMGIRISDAGAGIGTVTYWDPESGEFGGLGHGVYDAETGELLPLERGTVTDVLLEGVIRGAAGAPGELQGCLGKRKLGALYSNTTNGVFGVFAPAGGLPQAEALPLASCTEVQNGKAVILSSIDASGIASYQVEIFDLHPDAKGSKCFSVRVTDPILLEKTGGIVQGMSGSPIIQNGKFVGAVTHVLVNDPTVGYGIFLQNMLDAAK